MKFLRRTICLLLHRQRYHRKGTVLVTSGTISALLDITACSKCRSRGYVVAEFRALSGNFAFAALSPGGRPLSR
jgi:hypothetical protein